MALPIYKDDNQPFQLMQTKWKAELDPVLSNVIVSGLLLSSVSISSASANVINHTLGRKQQGWYLTDVNALATLYRSAALNDRTLTLTSNNDCVISLWVF